MLSLLSKWDGTIDPYNPVPDVALTIPFFSINQVIYVARNIKDAMVSYYHHKKLVPGLNQGFKEYAKCFRNNETEFNPFIPHILEAWKQKSHPNMFFTTYEDMKKDLRKVATELAIFMRGKGDILHLVHNTYCAFIILYASYH